MKTISKKEMQELVSGNSELATKARLDILQDTESELYQKIMDPDVSTTEEIPLTDAQAQAFERYENQVIENWASSKSNV